MQTYFGFMAFHAKLCFCPKQFCTRFDDPDGFITVYGSRLMGLD